jgi:hypothetical protein
MNFTQARVFPKAETLIVILIVILILTGLAANPGG